ncbi:MAG: hypothetical protein ACI8W7_002737 [Gammaproteobacteria bacterium]|jgi:uncharacterized protein (DUF58 family)
MDPTPISPAPGDAQTATGEALFDDAFLRKLERLDLLAHKIFRGQLRGEHTTPRRGRGIEFSDFRRYRPGDDLRYIDWNIYSRLDRLFLKLYATEEDISLHVLMDASASMRVGVPSKFDHARRISAALAYIGVNNLDRVSYTAFSAKLGAGMRSLKTRHQMPSLLALLADLPCDGSTDFGASLREFGMHARHPGIVVLISDLLGDDQLQLGIEALRGRGHEVFVLQLLAEQDIDPPLDGAMHLLDAESGVALNVTVDEQLRTLYQSNFQQRLSRLEQYCLRRGVEYLRASTAISFEDVVLKYLRRGALLK